MAELVERLSMEGMIFIRNENFLQEIGRALGKSGTVKVIEIGDGLLAVQCSDDDNFAVYFDTGRWRLLLHVEDRHQEVVFPPRFRNTGVITAYFLQKAMTSPEVVKAIAKLMLVPTARHYRLVSEMQR